MRIRTHLLCQLNLAIIMVLFFCINPTLAHAETKPICSELFQSIFEWPKINELALRSKNEKLKELQEEFFNGKIEIQNLVESTKSYLLQLKTTLGLYDIEATVVDLHTNIERNHIILNGLRFSLDRSKLTSTELRRLALLHKASHSSSITIDPNLWRFGTEAFFNTNDRSLFVGTDEILDLIFQNRFRTTVFLHEYDHAFFELKKRLQIHSIYFSSYDGDLAKYFDLNSQHSQSLINAYGDLLTAEELHNYARTPFNLIRALSRIDRLSDFPVKLAAIYEYLEKSFEISRAIRKMSEETIVDLKSIIDGKSPALLFGDERKKTIEISFDHGKRRLLFHLNENQIRLFQQYEYDYDTKFLNQILEQILIDQQQLNTVAGSVEQLSKKVVNDLRKNENGATLTVRADLRKLYLLVSGK